jgi:hypothetical protein
MVDEAVVNGRVEPWKSMTLPGTRDRIADECDGVESSDRRAHQPATARTVCQAIRVVVRCRGGRDSEHPPKDDGKLEPAGVPGVDYVGLTQLRRFAKAVQQVRHQSVTIRL